MRERTKERYDAFVARVDSKLSDVIARVEKDMEDTLKSITVSTKKFKEGVIEEARELAEGG